MSVDIRNQLASLLDHLDTHPHLNAADDSILSAGVDDGGLRVHAHSDDDVRLPVLAMWTRTLATVGHIEITATNHGAFPTCHLHAVGTVSDGTPVTVAVILRRDEFNLLAANTFVRDGATFPVELLLHLASTPAEAARA